MGGRRLRNSRKRAPAASDRGLDGSGGEVGQSISIGVVVVNYLDLERGVVSPGGRGFTVEEMNVTTEDVPEAIEGGMLGEKEERRSAIANRRVLAARSPHSIS